MGLIPQNNIDHGNTDYKRWIWYDGRDRVWQRWTYDTGEEEWSGTLNRYVYDGGALAQEHEVDAAIDEGSWAYDYQGLILDYLRKPGGIRQIERSGDTDTYQYLITDGGTPTARIEKNTNSLVNRVELTASGQRQMTGSTQDAQISNLGPGGGYIEAYGGTTSGQTSYFDPLVGMGGRHYLPSLEWLISRSGNHPHQLPLRCKVSISLSVGPLLPKPHEDCVEFWEDECIHSDWGPPRKCPNCVEPLLLRHHDWFAFCCENNCTHTSNIQIPGNASDCPCDIWFYNSCKGDCQCNHCEWGFGLEGTIYACPDIIHVDQNSCGSLISTKDQLTYMGKLCNAAAQCACRTYRDSTMKSHIDSQFDTGNWQGINSGQATADYWRYLWKCVAKVCKGNTGLSIMCERNATNLKCFHDTMLYGYSSPGNENIIHLCIDNINAHGKCFNNVILHEMMHLCGLNARGIEGNANRFIASKCIDESWPCQVPHDTSTPTCTSPSIGPCF